MITKLKEVAIFFNVPIKQEHITQKKKRAFLRIRKK